MDDSKIKPEHFIFIQPDKTIMFDFMPENVEGWKVTGELMDKIKANPYFDLVTQNGELVDIVPIAPPVVPQEPTLQERISAAEAALLGLMGG